MKPAKRRGTDSTQPLFTGFGLAALFKAQPDDMAVLAAIWYLHWRRSAKDPDSRGIDALCAVLCTPDPDERDRLAEAEADLPVDKCTPPKPRMSRRQVERAVSRLKRRGWVRTERTFGGRMAFYPTLPDITFYEAEALYKSANVADLVAPIPPPVAGPSANVAGPNSNNSYTTNNDISDQAVDGQAPGKMSKGQVEARVTSILRAFTVGRAALYPKAGSTYIVAPGDRKLARPMAEAGVQPEDIAARVAEWGRVADAYVRERKHPFWLFARAFNSLEPPDASSATPTHPRMPAI